MIVIADTSALLAAFDADQPDHDRARAVLDAEAMVISPLVLTELDHLVTARLNFETALAVQDALLSRMDVGQYRLASLGVDEVVRAQEVRRQYRSLQLDLADGVGVVLADVHRTNHIFTSDQRDFRAVTPLTPGFDAFRLLPADL